MYKTLFLHSEVCFLYDDEKQHLWFDNTQLSSNNYCTKKYPDVKILGHTHPLRRRGFTRKNETNYYPSFEDLFEPILTKIVEYQLTFTPFGLYISHYPNIPNQNQNMTEGVLRVQKNIIDKYFHHIYFITNDRINNTLLTYEQDVINNISEKNTKEISIVCNTVEKYINELLRIYGMKQQYTIKYYTMKNLYDMHLKDIKKSSPKKSSPKKSSSKKSSSKKSSPKKSSPKKSSPKKSSPKKSSPKKSSPKKSSSKRSSPKRSSPKKSSPKKSSPKRSSSKRSSSKRSSPN
jgi:hypothetical protein